MPNICQISCVTTTTERVFYTFSTYFIPSTYTFLTQLELLYISLVSPHSGIII